MNIYYNIKKGSKLGGKYGTKLAFNYATWSGLKGDFDITNRTYENTDLFGFGEKYFEEFSLDIKKKWFKLNEPCVDASLRNADVDSLNISKPLHFT